MNAQKSMKILQSILIIESTNHVIWNPLRPSVTLLLTEGVIRNGSIKTKVGYEPSHNCIEISMVDNYERKDALISELDFNESRKG